MRTLASVALIAGLLTLLASCARAPADPTPRPTPTTLFTLLDESGTGIEKTVTFTPTGVWGLMYVFDCGERPGNFIVTLYEPPDTLRAVLVNELARKGSNFVPEYAQGTFYLSVNSTCRWTVRAVEGRDANP